MALTVSQVFGSSASIESGDVLSIPRSNLAVLEGADDNDSGAEVVFALLEKLKDAPLSSGNITVRSSTSLVNGNQLRKSYTFSFTVGDIALSGLNVQ